MGNSNTPDGLTPASIWKWVVQALIAVFFGALLPIACFRLDWLSFQQSHEWRHEDVINSTQSEIEQRRHHDELVAEIRRLRLSANSGSEVQGASPEPDRALDRPVPHLVLKPPQRVEHVPAPVVVARLQGVQIDLQEGRKPPKRRPVKFSTVPLTLSVPGDAAVTRVSANWHVRGSNTIEGLNRDGIPQHSVVAVTRYPLPNDGASMTGLFRLTYIDRHGVMHSNDYPFVITGCRDHVHLTLEGNDAPVNGIAERYMTN